MGGGNYGAGGVAFFVYEPRDAGSGEDAGGNGFGTGGRKAAGDSIGEMWAGFAGVAADEDAWARGKRAKIFAEGEADAVERGIVERILSGDAANSVGAKKLFCHREITPRRTGAESLSVALARATTGR